MPLEAGAKPGTPGFVRNIATEVRAGKPVKQAAAIAYAKARGDAGPSKADLRSQLAQAKREEQRARETGQTSMAKEAMERAQRIQAQLARKDTDITSTFVSPAQMAEGQPRLDAIRKRADLLHRRADAGLRADDLRGDADTKSEVLKEMVKALQAKGASPEKIRQAIEAFHKDQKRHDSDDDIRPDGWRRRQGDLKKGKGRRDASPDPIAGYGPGDMLATKGDAGPGRREREAAFGWDPKWGKQPYDQHVRQNLMNDVPAVKEQTRQRRSEHSYVKSELKAGRRPYGDSLTAKLDALVERADAGEKRIVEPKEKKPLPAFYETKSKPYGNAKQGRAP